MTAPLLTNSQIEFINRAVKESKRCDGRRLDEFRKLKLHYGCELGSVLVCLGNTKVTARILSEIGTSSPTRPNEGVLRISADVSQLASFSKTYAKRLELVVLLQRFLEHAFVESRCLDMESLCIISELHVWMLHLNVTVLSDDGSLRDACCIAALAALMHYRRPEATVEDGKIRVYKSNEKEPILLSLRHYPTSVSYCFFENSKAAVVDPTWSEEKSSETQLTLCFNTFGELCACHLAGKSTTTTTTILKYGKSCINRTRYVLKRIRQALSIDETKRENKEVVGFITIFSHADSTSQDQEEDDNNEEFEIPENVKYEPVSEIVPSFKNLSTCSEKEPTHTKSIVPPKKSETEWPSLKARKKRR